MEDKVNSLQFEKEHLKDRVAQAEKDLKEQKNRLEAFEKIALAFTCLTTEHSKECIRDRTNPDRPSLYYTTVQG